MHDIPGQYFRTHESGGSPRCVQHIHIYNHNFDNQDQQMSLAEVEVFVGGGNVAGGGTAKQGDYSEQTAAPGGEAENAIDGNVASESLTEQELDRGGLWWKLDLGSEQDVDRIRITAPSSNGSDLEGAVVYARDSDYQILWSTRITGAADGSVHDLMVETCCTPP